MAAVALSLKRQSSRRLMIRPKKLPRLQELSDLLLDEAPTRDIHDGPASYNMINQLLTLATNSIALCQGAHLGALKMYQKRFLRLCFTKYESASNLRGPTSLEAQSADKRAWEIIAELVNQHAWKLDDALHEMSEVRADLSSLLAPRATLPKQLLNHQETWRPRYPGRGRGGKAGGLLMRRCPAFGPFAVPAAMPRVVSRCAVRESGLTKSVFTRLAPLSAGPKLDQAKKSGLPSASLMTLPTLLAGASAAKLGARSISG